MGGTRVSKCHPRVEAYGTVDELNAHVGLLAEMIRQTDAEQYDILKKVQLNLFIVQTLLATEADGSRAVMTALIPAAARDTAPTVKMTGAASMTTPESDALIFRSPLMLFRSTTACCRVQYNPARL